MVTENVVTSGLHPVQSAHSSLCNLDCTGCFAFSPVFLRGFSVRRLRDLP